VRVTSSLQLHTHTRIIPAIHFIIPGSTGWSASGTKIPQCQGEVSRAAEQ